MAGNAVIGALRVVLGADTAQLETGLKRAESSLDAFASGFKKALAGLSVAAVAGGIISSIKGMTDEADKFGKSAQKWGVPVEELSRLKHAADLSDVSFETLGASLSRLSRNMSEVAGGATSTASKAFEALGIKVKNTDGTLKTSSQVIGEIAGKFASYQDGAAKTALAMAIFGRAGAELIPMLNAGKTGLQEMADEADKLGIVVDTKTAKSAEAFNDNLTRMGKIKDAIILQVTARLLPAFERLSQVLIDAAKNSTLMANIARILTVALQGLVTAVIAVGAAFKAVGDIIGAVSSGIALAAQGKFQAAWDALKAGPTDVVETVKSAADAIKTIWVGAADASEAAAPELSKKLAAPIIQSVEKAKDAMKALDAFFLSGTKRMASMQADLATIGMSAGAHEKLKYELQAINIAREKGIPLTDELRAKIEAEATKLGELANKLEETKERYNDLKTSVLAVRSSLENAFVDAVTQANSLRNVVSSLIKDFARLAAQSAFRQLFGGTGAWTDMAGGLFGMGGNPNLAGSGFGPTGIPFGGARALGGPVSSGVAHLVGERGPELFVPSMSGTVISNRELQGGGSGGAITLNMPITVQGDANERTLAILRREIPATAIAAVREAQSRRVL